MKAAHSVWESGSFGLKSLARVGLLPVGSPKRRRFRERPRGFFRFGSSRRLSFLFVVDASWQAGEYGRSGGVKPTLLARPLRWTDGVRKPRQEKMPSTAHTLDQTTS